MEGVVETACCTKLTFARFHVELTLRLPRTRRVAFLIETGTWNTPVHCHLLCPAHVWRMIKLARNSKLALTSFHVKFAFLRFGTERISLSCRRNLCLLGLDIFRMIPSTSCAKTADSVEAGIPLNLEQHLIFLVLASESLLQGDSTCKLFHIDIFHTSRSSCKFSAQVESGTLGS